MRIADTRVAPVANAPLGTALPQRPDRFTAQPPTAPLNLIPRPDTGSLSQLLTGSATPPPHTRMFADSYGRVTHMALMMSPYVSGDERTDLLGAYKTLFTEMEPDTRFVVVVQTDQDQADVQQVMADNHVPNPERITFLKPNVGDLTVWARDMMVGMFLPDDAAHTALLHQTTMHSWHENDMQVPGHITAADPTIVLDTEPSVVTDGGDVQSNTKQAFVGYYSIVSTEMNIADEMSKDAGLKTRLVDYYQTHYAKQVVMTDDLHFPFKKVITDSSGSSPVYELDPDPDFHPTDPGPGKVTEQQMLEDLAVQLFHERTDKPIQMMGKDDPSTPHLEQPATDHMDMGCTPIDDNTFMVGDPGLAQSLIASMTPAERQQAEAVLSKAAGRPFSLSEFRGSPGGPFSPRNRDNQDDFDAYQKTLQGDGYKVVRLPHAEPSSDNNPYISYNNCLMERFDKDGKEVRRVFLPQYGIPKLDDYAVKAWQSQGYEVHGLPLAALSAMWGAIRCSTNWLDRFPRG